MNIKIIDIVKLAKKSGDAILEVYNSEDFEIEMKIDDKQKGGYESPLTKADRISNDIICDYLKSNYDYPIISEEIKEIDYEQRKIWSDYWLIDPMDGTKEFVKRNGEFTVNIAFVSSDKPVFGLIYVPVSGVFYFAMNGIGSYRLDKYGEFDDDNMLIEKSVRLPCAKTGKFTVVASKSHMSDENMAFVEGLRVFKSELNLVSKGSSLKFCLVAEGNADIYPRLVPCMEWDTAAAHVIVNEAGKKVFKYKTNDELVYNKKNLLSPFFVVR